MNFRSLDHTPLRPPGEYLQDPGLTKIGWFMGVEWGRTLRRVGFRPTTVVASPHWRSMETAAALLSGYGREADEGEINISYDCGMIANTGAPVPPLLSVQQLLNFGFPMAAYYNPYQPNADFVAQETTLVQKYLRHDAALRHCMRSISGDFVIVTSSSSSLEYLSRLAVGRVNRSADVIKHIEAKTPVLSSIMLKKKVDGSYAITRSVVPPMTIQGHQFDPDLLISPEIILPQPQHNEPEPNCECTCM